MITAAYSGYIADITYVHIHNLRLSACTWCGISNAWWPKVMSRSTALCVCICCRLHTTPHWTDLSQMQQVQTPHGPRTHSHLMAHAHQTTSQTMAEMGLLGRACRCWITQASPATMSTLPLLLPQHLLWQLPADHGVIAANIWELAW